MYNHNETFIEKYWMWSIPIVLISIFVYCVWPRQYVAEIIGSEWTRYYQIQVMKTVKKYNRDYVPNGARVFNRDSEYVCSGTGKDRTCNWETEYDYEIEEFVDNRIVSANGIHGTSEPRWPDYTLSPVTGPNGIGQERVYNNIEQYVLTFKTKDGETYEKSLSMVEWNTFNIRQTVYITTSLGFVTKIHSLEN